MSKINVFKLIDLPSGYYMYFTSHAKNIEIAGEQIEHTISNTDDDDVYKFLNSRDWEHVDIVQETQLKAIDIINENFPSDVKCLNNANSDYKSLIPPPKEPKKKREPKPKADKVVKDPKPKAKKATSGKVVISNDIAETRLNMN